MAVVGPASIERDNYLRQLFLSFGHVVHLVQDMAQPEHTRNDQHLTGSNLLPGGGGTTAPSIWEAWGAENLVTKSKNGQTVSPVVSYDGYPTVVLPDYESYFHNEAGQGMSDFSNRNFVTQDTNYSDEDSPGRCYYHAAPRIADAARRVEKNVTYVYLDDQNKPVPITVDEEIYTSFPSDAYTGFQEQDPFHTYFSSLDLEAEKYGFPTFSLGDGSFLSRAAMLIPRAVGYSTGIINHFFRGKVNVAWKSVGNGVYEMTITNVSSEPIGPDARVEAVFRADPGYFDMAGTFLDTGAIVEDDLADLIPGFAGLAPGQSVTISGLQPPKLKPGDSLAQFERRVAIIGTLGSIPGEVVGLVQPPEAAAYKIEVDWSGEPLPILLGLELDQDGFGIAINVDYFTPSFPGTPRYEYITTTKPENPDRGPMSISLNPPKPGYRYEFYIVRSDRFPPLPINVKIYENGVLTEDRAMILSNPMPNPFYGWPIATFP